VPPYEVGGTDAVTQTLLLSLSGARGRRTVGSRGLLCTDALWVPCAVDPGGAGDWESISTPAALAERAECCDAWTEITEGHLSQQKHFMIWTGICRPEPPYDTHTFRFLTLTTVSTTSRMLMGGATAQPSHMGT
jgi:hypothetical protein